MKSVVFLTVLVAGCVATMPDDPTLTADLAWGTAGVVASSRQQSHEPEPPAVRHCTSCGGRGVVDVQTPEPTVCKNAAVPADAAIIVLEVDENARVAINGGDTAATGRIRQYQAAGLVAGNKYEFVVRVDDDTRVITMTAGEQANLSFLPAIQTCRECGGTGLPDRSVIAP